MPTSYPRTSAASGPARKSSSSSSSQATPATSRSQGTKRKMETDAAQQQTKYYAVQVGLKTGVFTSWGECQQYITGFPGAKYKSFLSREDAQAFVAGRNPPNSKDEAKPIRYYGVAVGRKPGVYTDWNVAQKQIDGWKGPKYRKFDTFEDAAAFVRSVRASLHSPPLADLAEDDEEESPPVAKKIKRDNPPAAQTKAKREVAPPAPPKKRSLTVVYTDGSARGNGQVGARAGYGVWFGPHDPRNISERLQGDLQTNQRAELTAVLKALETIPVADDVEIKTDSNYSIKCVVEWYFGWKAKGWLAPGSTKVKNIDLVQAIRKVVDARDNVGTQTKFTWVKGHANEPGNVAADDLAVRGAMKPL